MKLHQTIDAAFPIVANNELAMLDLVTTIERRGYVYLVLRLMTFERRDGGLRVIDVKQQRVRFVSVAEPSWRVERYMSALARVLERLLDSAQMPDVKPLDAFDACPLHARTERQQLVQLAS